jgi:cytochrome P450
MLSVPGGQSSARIEDYDDADFDPFSTYDRAVGLSEVENPYPRFHELHCAGAVQQGDIRECFGLERFALWAKYPSYMVFGHDNVSRALLDASVFSSSISEALYTGTFGQSISAMDAPDHHRYRALFQQAFLPKPLKVWGAAAIPGVIGKIVDTFKGSGAAELVREFTVRFPFEILYAQLGLPEEELAAFRRLSAGLMCTLVDFPHANEASKKMGAYFGRLIVERRGREGDDFISMLANAEVQGDRLPDEITISFLRQLMNAAGDTTYRSTGSLLVGLLENPDQLAAVRADRTLIPQAIDEALRWEGPLPTLVRMTLRDVEMDGVVIPARSKVDVITGTANRDPSRHEEPDRFNIFRTPVRHLAFAYGPHICLGQHLVRIEMERAVNTLLDCLPNMRLDPSKPPPAIIGLHARAADAIHVLFDAR